MEFKHSTTWNSSIPLHGIQAFHYMEFNIPPDGIQVFHYTEFKYSTKWNLNWLNGFKNSTT